jgi:hypothetical protein
MAGGVGRGLRLGVRFGRGDIENSGPPHPVISVMGHERAMPVLLQEEEITTNEGD